MVHSIELVFDRDTEAAVRRIWEELAGAGIPSQAPASRPHVTMAVADRISSEVDELLSPVAATLPLSCAIGAPVLFGRASVVFARLVVPTVELLALHSEVHWLCAPYLDPAPMPNSLPGHWTGHVTLARRVGGAQLGRALRIAGRPAQINGSFAGLRRWDGNNALSNRSHDGAQHGEITAQRAVGYRVRFVQPCTATLSWQFCARQARARPQILTKTRGVLGDSGGYSTQQ